MDEGHEEEDNVISMGRVAEFVQDTEKIHLLSQQSPPTPGFDLFATKLGLTRRLAPIDGCSRITFEIAGIEWILISVYAQHFKSIKVLAENCGLRFDAPPERIAVFSGASAVFGSDNENGQLPLGCVVNWIPFPIQGDTLFSLRYSNGHGDADIPKIIRQERIEIERLLEEDSGTNRAYT